jgi:hypothetical protein
VQFSFTPRRRDDAGPAAHLVPQDDVTRHATARLPPPTACGPATCARAPLTVRSGLDQAIGSIVISGLPAILAGFNAPFARTGHPRDSWWGVCRGVCAARRLGSNAAPCRLSAAKPYNLFYLARLLAAARLAGSPSHAGLVTTIRVRSSNSARGLCITLRSSRFGAYSTEAHSTVGWVTRPRALAIQHRQNARRRESPRRTCKVWSKNILGNAL